MVFKHCSDILRAIISIEASHCDCATLFRTLSTTKFEKCDRFGSYLYLITCKRVCDCCFVTKASYFPVSSALAMQNTTLQEKDFGRVPHIRSVAGYYSPFRIVTRKPIMLFDRWHLRDWLLPNAIPRILHPRIESLKQETRRFISIISAPYFTSSGRCAEWGFFCDICRDLFEFVECWRIKYTEEEFRDHLVRFGIDHDFDPREMMR